MAKKQMSKKSRDPFQMAATPAQTGPDKYHVEDAARTLVRAEEIKRDKSLYPHVQRHLGKQHDMMKALVKGKK